MVLRATAAGELSGALILARLWRFVRVAHGVATSTHEAAHGGHADQMHGAIEKLRERIAELEGHAGVQLASS